MRHAREHLTNQFAKQPSHVLVLPCSGSGGETVLADALDACNGYFVQLVSLVFDAYDQFKCVVDPRWYYTQPHFEAQGRTFVDALAELGFPPSWAAACPSEIDGWRILRAQQPPCAINALFERCLGKRIKDPDWVEN